MMVLKITLQAFEWVMQYFHLHYQHFQKPHLHILKLHFQHPQFCLQLSFKVIFILVLQLFLVLEASQHPFVCLVNRYLLCSCFGFQTCSRSFLFLQFLFVIRQVPSFYQLDLEHRLTFVILRIYFYVPHLIAIFHHLEKMRAHYFWHQLS